MQTMVPLYGFGGGGGTGASLTVNAPAGCTVTVSKDGKTKTKTAGTDGTAVFNGLATGTWTVTIKDGEQTAQKTVHITADYSTAIMFFAATIHVTYPAGSTCTATDGTTTLSAPDTSGTWDCVVPNAGTWMVSLDSGFAEDVSVTENGGTYAVDKWYIYKVGDLRESITGGWKAAPYSGQPMGSIELRESCVEFSTISQQWTPIVTNKKIPLMSTTLCMDISVVSGKGYVDICLVTTNDTIVINDAALGASGDVNAGTSKTVKMSTEAFVGQQMYVSVVAIGYSGVSSVFIVKNIYFEAVDV